VLAQKRSENFFKNQESGISTDFSAYRLIGQAQDLPLQFK